MTSPHHSDSVSVTENRTVRHIAGFIAGFAVFMILLPAILWGLSVLENRFLDISIFPSDPLRISLSVIVFLWGMCFVIWSNTFLVFVGKGGPANVGNVVISPLTRKLVVSGPYRYTRNPMVFGANAVYLSISIYLDSWMCLLALGFFVFTIVRTAVRMEEARLLRDFGAEYEAYRDTTSMIIPLPPRK